MSSESIIEEQNPELYAAIVKRIKNVPDPRPATVQATYDEKWSIDAAWNRLLHELTSLSIDGDDGLLLEAIQDNKLASQRNLRARLAVWAANYPMVMWTLTITNPTSRRYIDVAIGDESMVAAITSRQITPELIDHIRDTKTVRTLRQTKGGGSNISDTFGVLKRSIRDEKFGKVWWIVAGVRLKDFNGDDIDKELAYVFNNHQDDEALWPLIESGELDTTNFATIDVGPNSPPSDNYGHLLRFAWDATLKNADTNNYDLLRKFIYHVWTPSNIAYPYVDDSLARYMVKTYHHKMGISSYILNSFVHPAYLNVWRDVLPYLQLIGARNYIPIGQIAILAHSIGADDVALEYAKAFGRLNNPNEFNATVVDAVGNMVGFVWLYEQLTPSQQTAMFWGIRDVYIKHDDDSYNVSVEPLHGTDGDVIVSTIEHSYYGATLPIRYYDDILKDVVTRKLMKKTLVKVIIAELKDPNADVARLKYALEMFESTLTRSIFVSIKMHKTAGRLFINLISKDVLNENYWIIKMHKETMEALIDAIGYPCAATIISLYDDLYDNINYELLDLSTHEKLLEYADAGSFGNLSLYDQVKIAKKYDLKSKGMFGEKFVARFMNKELLKLPIETINDVLTILPNDASWSDLLLHPHVYNHRDVKEIIILLLRRGADPSYRSSSALIRELSLTRRPDIIRLLATAKSMKNVSNAVKTDVETLLKND